MKPEVFVAYNSSVSDSNSKVKRDDFDRLAEKIKKAYSRLMSYESDFLLKMANTKMPFGKYSGRYLVDLPETYVIWFANKGYPEGELGKMLASMYEIKANGLESLIRPLITYR